MDKTIRDFVVKTLSSVSNQGGYQLSGFSDIEFPVLPPFEDLATKLSAISRELAAGFPKNAPRYVHVKFDRGSASNLENQYVSI